MQLFCLRRRNRSKILLLGVVFAIFCFTNGFFSNIQAMSNYFTTRSTAALSTQTISEENRDNALRYRPHGTAVLHSKRTESRKSGNNVTSNTTKHSKRTESTGNDNSRTVYSSERSAVSHSKHIGSNGIASNVTETTTWSTTTEQQKELPFKMFRYPLDINFRELIINVSKTGKTHVKPINVYPFTYRKPMGNICNSTQELYLLFVIKSAPGHFLQRQTIRETWTNQTFIKQDIIRHVFLLAQTMNRSINDRLSEEEEKYSDIVQMTYVDSYYNNTYKTIGGINWCVKYCSQAKFVMMVDDDFYVATDLLLHYLHGLPNSKKSSLFAGYKAVDTPQRRQTDKWYMSIDEYPFERYPPFISAGAMIMSMDFVTKLQIAIPFTKKFKFDDVFIAIVAHKLGVQPVHLSNIYIIHGIRFGNKLFKTMIASHRYNDTTVLKNAWYHHLQERNLTQKD